MTNAEDERHTRYLQAQANAWEFAKQSAKATPIESHRLAMIASMWARVTLALRRDNGV